MTADAVIPRSEYPRPQFERAPWINLNGKWSYVFDPAKSGLQRGLTKSSGFDNEILVPFCPESSLSGLRHTDFIECMWYHRTIEIPQDWTGKLVLLHFGAVDFESEVFIDGVSAGTHYGGTCSFYHDITPLVSPGGSHHLVLHVRDEIRSARQPSGKQSHAYASQGCHYTRTTGIWQTVWIEAVSPCGLEQIHIIPDLDAGRFVLIPRYFTTRRNQILRATLLDHHQPVAAAQVPAVDAVALTLNIDQPKPWAPAHPFLYDLSLELVDQDGQVQDSVKSYCGLRKVHIEGNCLYLNNEPLFLRQVLDQGFYPDGIWTAPSDHALKRDIELAMDAGFNGARLHQKVFEHRYHYWADQLGFLTWGESAAWGLACWRLGHQNETDSPEIEAAALNFLTEWREIIIRDRNHPSIVAWTPFNETRNPADWRFHNRIHRQAYAIAAQLDPTRPINDASGYVHVQTDLWTVHAYEQDPHQLNELLTPKPDTGVYRNYPAGEPHYTGQPYLVDEFGGIKWIAPDHEQPPADAWGYGQGPKTPQEFYQRLEALVDVLLRLDHLAGYCYTQLTDVEQERNGIYNYDRSEKFDLQVISRIFNKLPDRHRPSLPR